MSEPLEAPDLWDALTRAAFQVEQESPLLQSDAASADEVRAATAALVDGLRRAALGLDIPAEGIPRTTLTRKVLRLLRERFLDQVGAGPEPPDARNLLRLLQSFERLGEVLTPSWDQRFGERLAGPDGLELVVEVAHDLRSPLTSILFLAETLLRGRSGPITSLQERQLGLIYSAAFGLSSVASDVVELVRGRDRLMEFDPFPFCIQDLFESVRDIVRPIAEEKGLGLRLELPQRCQRVGHPVAVNRVLLNLTTNALKFTDQGYVELAAREIGDDHVEFSVRDTGRGIPESAMALLFEPFRRRQREGEYAFSGAGLGLSICRKLVEAMGSELRVETTLGEGTRFVFTLTLPLPAAGLPETAPDAAAVSPA